MIVTIVTITYNSASTLEQTILSVLEQDHKDVEYIIIDGLSSDSTLDIVAKHQHKVNTLISEKDDGLYFALNKGLELAKGDIIGILHSDDSYSNKYVLSKVVKAFKEDPELEALYGDLVFVDRNDPTKKVRSWNAGEYRDGDFLKGWMPPHPTFFVKRSVYEKYGTFNTSFEFAADYELMLRLIHKHKIKIKYLPETLVDMKMGGVSNSSLMGKIKANIEDRRAWKVNDLRPKLFTTLRKPLSKVRQYLRS